MKKIRTLSEELMDIRPMSEAKKFHELVALYSREVTFEEMMMSIETGQGIDHCSGEDGRSGFLIKGELYNFTTFEQLAVFAQNLGFKVYWNKPFIQQVFGVNLF